jgi:hypothetical protein
MLRLFRELLCTLDPKRRLGSIAPIIFMALHFASFFLRQQLAVHPDPSLTGGVQKRKIRKSRITKSLNQAQKKA